MTGGRLGLALGLHIELFTIDPARGARSIYIKPTVLKASVRSHAVAVGDQEGGSDTGSATVEAVSGSFSKRKQRQGEHSSCER